MTHPWMQFWTRDWLDSKELRRCSPAARGLLADLMAIAHEGYPYGYLADKVGALGEEYLASRCVLSVEKFRSLLAELKGAAERVAVNEAGVLYVPRLVEDAALREKKKAAGKKGGNPKLLKHEDNHGGLPTRQPRSDSGYISDSKVLKPENPKHEIPSDRFDEFWKKYPRKAGINEARGDWLSVVTVANEGAVFSCLDRYLGSSDVKRGAIMNAGSGMRDLGWIMKCHRDNWESDWPKAHDATQQTTAHDVRRSQVLAGMEVLDQIRRS